jgi:hypothetical protein
METFEAEVGAPVPLTDAQVEQVSGGLALSLSSGLGTKFDFRPAGCLACTSGGNFKLFDKWQEVINPVAPAIDKSVTLTRTL